MQILKDFNSHYRWTSYTPEMPATSMSRLLSRDWARAKSVVNDDQKAVVVFSRDVVEAILVPPSFLYESYRASQSIVFSDPVLHVREDEFRSSYKSATKSNMCKDVLDNDGFLVVVNDEGKAEFGVLPFTYGALLGLDEHNQVNFRYGAQEIMFSDNDVEINGLYLNENLRMTRSEQTVLFKALDALEGSARNRDDMHNAIRALRLDL